MARPARPRRWPSRRSAPQADKRAAGDGRGRRRARPDQGGDERRADRARRHGVRARRSPAPYTATGGNDADDLTTRAGRQPPEERVRLGDGRPRGEVPGRDRQAGGRLPRGDGRHEEGPRRARLEHAVAAEAAAEAPVPAVAAAVAASRPEAAAAVAPTSFRRTTRSSSRPTATTTRPGPRAPTGPTASGGRQHDGAGTTTPVVPAASVGSPGRRRSADAGRELAVGEPDRGHPHVHSRPAAAAHPRPAGWPAPSAAVWRVARPASAARFAAVASRPSPRCAAGGRDPAAARSARVRVRPARAGALGTLRGGRHGRCRRVADDAGRCRCAGALPVPAVRPVARVARRAGAAGQAGSRGSVRSARGAGARSGRRRRRQGPRRRTRRDRRRTSSSRKCRTGSTTRASPPE